MTKIDFYISPNEAESAPEETEPPCSQHLVACRVIEKAYRKQMHVYVHTDTESLSNTIDELLWSYRPNAFVPHCKLTDEDIDSSSVIIGSGSDPSPTIDAQPCDLLVNLSTERPEFFARYKRLAEIVSAEDQAKAASRDRYRYYQQRGYPLAVHQL